MDIFGKVCMGIRNVMPEIAMHHLVSAIRPDRFIESLIKRPTKNMDELRNRAIKFMQIEKHIDYHGSHQFEGADKGKEKDKDKGSDLYQVRLSVSEKIRDPIYELHAAYSSKGKSFG